MMVTMPRTATFGQRLRAAIRGSYRTQEEFAGKIGIDPSTISGLVNDRFVERPEDATLQKLADGLGLTLEVMYDWLGIEFAPGDGPAPDLLAKVVDDIRSHAPTMAKLRELSGGDEEVLRVLLVETAKVQIAAIVG
jgi:transcriptional regulator with XRE-family HTH domain